MLELAHFRGTSNTPETRAAIVAALERALEVAGLLDRLEPAHEVVGVPRPSIDVVEVAGETRAVVRTSDPALILKLANRGLLEDPGAAGLVRVEGAHGAVWAWPAINV